MTETKKLKVNPYTQADFAWALWDVATIRNLPPWILENKKSKLALIKAVPADQRTFENTVYALEASDYEIDPKVKALAITMSVNPESAIRDAAKQARDDISDGLVEIAYDEEIYRALKGYESKEEKLEGDQAKLFKEMLRSYRRMGFELPKEQREIVKSKKKELNKLCTQFEKNINDYHDSLTLQPDQTAGLTQTYLDGLKRDTNGDYIVTLEYPDLIPFLENSVIAEKRKELADKNSRKGGKQNLKLLEEILGLRDEVAKILGYLNHAWYVIEIKMAKTPTKALEFVEDLIAKLEQRIGPELAELSTLKKQETGEEKIYYYDVAYYANQLKKQKFDVDGEKIREYFPFEVVKTGVFQIYSQLLSVSFHKVNGIPLWHPDVELYEVHDDDGSLLSYFLLDLYPRDGKYGHAMAEEVVPGREDLVNNCYVAPVCVMVANFNKLMSHDEVETFLHEFGHVMHDTLTKARYASQVGFWVAWDFVEAPSQMLENWAWNKDMLKLLSGYHQDHEKKLPDDLIEKMLKAKKHMIAFNKVSQLVRSLFDLKIHEGHQGDDLPQFNRELREKYLGVSSSPNSLYPAGFGHLCNGYDAGYYGYMWSEVFAADMFSRFKKEGLLNSKTGADYRHWILERGATMEEIDLVRRFLGREPSNEAFLKELE